MKENKPKRKSVKASRKRKTKPTTERPAKLTELRGQYWDEKAVEEAEETLSHNVDIAERDAARMILVISNQDSTEPLEEAIEKLAYHTGITLATPNVLCESYPRMVSALQDEEIIYGSREEATAAHQRVLELLALIESGHKLPERQSGTGAPEDKNSVAALAVHLCAIMAHPLTPADLYNSLTDTVHEIWTDYAATLESNPQHFAPALAFRLQKDAEKGGEQV